MIRLQTHVEKVRVSPLTKIKQLLGIRKKCPDRPEVLMACISGHAEEVSLPGKKQLWTMSVTCRNTFSPFSTTERIVCLGTREEVELLAAFSFGKERDLAAEVVEKTVGIMFIFPTGKNELRMNFVRHWKVEPLKVLNVDQFIKSIEKVVAKRPELL